MSIVFSNMGPEVVGTATGFTIVFDPDGGKMRLDLIDSHQVEAFLKLDTSAIGGMELFTRILGPDGEELSLGFYREAKIGFTQFHREKCIGRCGKREWFLGRRPTNRIYGGYRCDNCFNG